jgi:hypothetical protein
MELRSFACPVLVVALAALAGCGGAESTVTGTVTLDGQPVGPGVIVFASAGGASNPSDGAIQVDGSYFLRTGREEGLTPGDYHVGVTVLDQPAVKPGERSMEVAKYITPQKYAEPSTSGLQFTVEAGSNTIDVKLSSE